MMTAWAINIDRDDVTKAEMVTADMSVSHGEILVQIDSYAMTANNVTYAAMGGAMKYWDFFPAPDGFGIVPVWGHARVVASNADGFDVGELEQYPRAG